ncbi:glyoxalase superfamily protein [Reyranella sp. CPCC 100927]|uniref:glyoxalase superfamily protein n=1 Tax=Reyranella sp. CPCC 100927 TaxID=2599616 RepID=UPI0011B5D1F2|nr:glyoxalase superfamily protein [Reyranella sp. CPCC 100927]TWT15029.1 VOC family protein [Reyranella sp. CPCC 100927]
MSAVLHPAIPILRIFDVDKAKEFYLDFLGFALDWEHRFTPDLPLYVQISRGGVTLHLSEHYGDGTPGSAVYIKVDNIGGFLRELHDKKARFARPDPNDQDVSINDPFGNILRFDGSRD